jgi:hypothetical protein
MKRWLSIAAFAALAGCALGSRDAVRTDIEEQSGKVDTSAQENDARISLGQIENALAGYVKTEKSVPSDLDALVPKYLADLPPVDVPVCGSRKEGSQNYPSSVLRDGQVDGTRIKGTGLWGYVHNDERVVVFIDCLKPASSGTPWYRVRGIY